MALKNTFFGKNIEFWVGKIVKFDDQKSQLSGIGGKEYWGWRYKVRIIGDYSATDAIDDKDVHTATALLPTTSGTGAAGRFSTVKLTQGDMVLGAFLAPNYGFPVIFHAFGRTEQVVNLGGKFGVESGYTEKVTPTEITGDQEFTGNKQVQTPILQTNATKGSGNDPKQTPTDSLEKQGISTEKEPVDGAIPDPETPKTEIGKSFVQNDKSEGNPLGLGNPLIDPKVKEQIRLDKILANEEGKSIDQIRKESAEKRARLDAKDYYTDEHGITRVRPDSPIMKELQEEREITKGSFIYSKVDKELGIKNSKDVALGNGVGASDQDEREAQYHIGKECVIYDSQVYNVDDEQWEDPPAPQSAVVSEKVTYDKYENKTTVTIRENGSVTTDLQYKNGGFKETTVNSDGSVDTNEVSFY